MKRIVCLSLLVVFSLSTFRNLLPSSKVGKLSVAVSDESYPFDEDTSGESDSDSDASDTEDLDLQIAHPLSLSTFSHHSLEVILLQQHIFDSLPIEVITPPPQS